MNKDLYAALDVDKTATTKDIKKSYRNKAKTEHPDKGGDPECFQLINLAHRILTDDEKRKDYDETGNMKERDEKALMKSQAFNVFQAILMHIQDVETTNVIQACITNINRDIKKKQQNEKGIEATRKKIRLTILRLKSKNGDMFLANNLVNMEIAATEAIAANQKEIKMLTDIIKYFENHEYEVDIKPAINSFATTSSINDLFTEVSLWQ